MAAALVLAAAAKPAPFIDWTALGKVAGVSAIFGIAVVVLFSLGIVGLSAARGHDVEEVAAGTVGDGHPGTTVTAAPIAGNRTLGAVLAAVCFVVCAAAVVYGLYLIIPQFH